MTFTTLSHIHSLLKEDAEKKERQTEWLRKLWYAAEEEDPNTVKADRAHAEYTRAKAGYDEAYAALQDFLSHDFR